MFGIFNENVSILFKKEQKQGTLFMKTCLAWLVFRCETVYSVIYALREKKQVL